MQSPAGIGRRWRRFNRKYGVLVMVAMFAVGAMVLVGLLMWMLSTPEFRARW